MPVVFTEKPIASYYLSPKGIHLRNKVEAKEEVIIAILFYF
ncbi:MAG TPA: hypothetical protein PK111_08005 [Atribacterota bacterium]|nr:hypothetical protein [Atribacterota bacterium]